MAGLAVLETGHAPAGAQGNYDAGAHAKTPFPEKYPVCHSHVPAAVLRDFFYVGTTSSPPRFFQKSARQTRPRLILSQVFLTRFKIPRPFSAVTLLFS